MTSRRVVWILALLAVVLVSAVGFRIVQSQRAAKAASSVPKPTVVLELPAEDIVTARQQELASVIEISGTVRAARTALVKAKVASEIRQMSVREGDAVRQGQTLVQLDATEFEWRLRQAEQQAQAARAQLDIARRTLANNKALVEQGFISATALESSASNDAGAQANLQAATAAVELARKALADTVLTAPLSGVVSQRLAQPGERVGVDARILEIVDLSALEIEAALTPAEVARLSVGQRASVRIDGLTESIAARVVRISPSAQAGSRTVPVYLALDRHSALRHGLFARGKIHLSQITALAVPASAVRRDQAEPYVFVLADGRIRSQRVVTGLQGTGADGQDWQVVSQGLIEGAQVLAGTVAAVTDGTAWRPAATPAKASSAPASR
jgi:RND family efflux transporter MFP subunit